MIIINEKIIRNHKLKLLSNVTVKTASKKMEIFSVSFVAPKLVKTQKYSENTTAFFCRIKS